MPENHDVSALYVVGREYEKARYQLGTLGGGNHFIEIQKGSDGHVWIMIHSGSRNIGKQVADYYNQLAEKFNREQGEVVPKSAQLDFLYVDSPAGKSCFQEMQYCRDFAYANREYMMHPLVDVFERIPGLGFQAFPMINIDHNYAARERYFGREVFVHCKGATLADAGRIGQGCGNKGVIFIFFAVFCARVHLK